MRFLFAAGDILETRPIAFDEVEKGDVIVFSHEKKMIVHRVHRKSPDFFVTMGDNNAACDAWQLTRKDEFQLVETRITKSKRRIAVRRGKRGMMRFYWNRFLRFGARCAAFGGRQLVRIADWREPLPAPEKFGDEFCYVVRGRTVAWKNGENGVVLFSRWTDRLKYRSH